MDIENVIKTYIPKGIIPERQSNCLLFKVDKESLAGVCGDLYVGHRLPLKTMVATDERKARGVFRIYYVFGIPGQAAFIVPYVELKDGESFPSLVKVIYECSGYEREIHTLFGLVPEGHPDLRSLILHEENWPTGVFPLRKDFSWEQRPAMERLSAEYEFKMVEGEGVYEIPVGPVHAGIIEPGHFRFSVMGEEIISLEPRLGYVHKGSEKLFEVVPVDKKVKLSERISGDSSFNHSLAFCQAVEILSGLKVSARANFLRVIFAELERLANHLGDIGAIMIDTGFSFGGSNGARLRERVMQVNEWLSGSRFLRGVNIVGGVTRDITSAQAEELQNVLDSIADDFSEVIGIVRSRISLYNRLAGTGTLLSHTAEAYGVLGIAGRAVGRNFDARVDYPYAAYGSMPLSVAMEESGDVLARFNVRIKEVINSFEIIKHSLVNMPQGDIATNKPPTLTPNSFAVSVVEGWRGDIVYIIMTDSQGDISRVKVRDISFLNWQAVPHAVTSDMVPDFPLINKSFNLSYSGNDL